MNNNRGNNRRRGRGNNRQQGGQQTNRIDSRARGNAPQLLEKYRKLAHDAHLNGDRVTEEYYLQFADHYFRVIADQRQRQEETRQPRRDDRSQDYGDDYGSDDDTYGENAQSGYNAAGNDRRPRFEREPQGQAPAEEQTETVETVAAEAAEDDRSIYDPVENPFVRSSRGLKQRKPRRRANEEDGNTESKGESEQEAPAGNLDPATLPPSISTKSSDKPAEEAAEEKPKRRRTRKAAPPAGEAGDTLEAVNG